MTTQELKEKTAEMIDRKERGHICDFVAELRDMADREFDEENITHQAISESMRLAADIIQKIDQL